MKGFGEQSKSTKKILKKNTSSREKIINQAFKLHSQGNISEASKLYQYFISQGFVDHRVFSNYGVILQGLGKSKEAELLYRKAINIKPDFADAHYNLGIILKDLGKFKEAELLYRKAIDIKPGYAGIHLNLGNLLKDLGKLKEAELSYRKVIELKPDFADVHLNLGNLLKDLGKLEEAKLSVLKAIELKPDFAMAHANLGTIMKDLGNLQKAKLSVLKAIELKPNYAEAYSYLGNILIDLGKLEEAELSLHKAIEINPNLLEAHYNLGTLMKNLGNLQKAKLSILKAIEINPNFAEAHYNLGIILGNLGKSKEALIHLIKAAELKPKDDKLVLELAHNLCCDKEYELALKYLGENQSNSSQSLYLGCLLSLNREKEFNEKYKLLSEKKVCNADIGGIVEHANIIYEKQYESPFCNKAIEYVLIDKINEDLFSTRYLNQLISYNKTSKKEARSQGLLTNGIQTSGNLFSLDYPFMKAMKKALEVKIEQYKHKFKDSGQGFIKNWPSNYELRSWIISMKSGGFLAPHNHEYGWITGSFYLQIPKYNELNNNSGNIAFSYQGPRYPHKDKIFNLTIKKIETRDICIFPSSLFHHTIPFKSTEDRICFVFDLVQRNNIKNSSHNHSIH